MKNFKEKNYFPCFIYVGSNKLFNDLYETDVFNSDDKEIQVLQNKVLELLV